MLPLELSIILGAAALLCFYIGIKLIINVFPNLIPHRKVARLEEGMRTASVVSPLLKSPKVGFWGNVLANSGLLSYWVEHEHRLMIKTRASNLSQTLERQISSDQFAHCQGAIYTTKSALALLHSLNRNEFDYQEAAAERDLLERNLPDSLRLLRAIEGRAQQVAADLDRLNLSPNEMVLEVADALSQTFRTAMDNLAETKLSNLDGLVSVQALVDSIAQLASQAQPSDGTLPKPATPSVDYYELLGLKPDATPEEIKRAYRRQTLRLHPDTKQAQISRLTDPDLVTELEQLFEEKTKSLNEAYDVLSDPAKRERYDRERTHG